MEALSKYMTFVCQIIKHFPGNRLTVLVRTELRAILADQYTVYDRNLARLPHQSASLNSPGYHSGMSTKRFTGAVR